MIRYRSQKQLSLAEFEWLFQVALDAVTVKHNLCLSNEETVQQIRENPYLQYFVGLVGYQKQAPHET